LRLGQPHVERAAAARREHVKPSTVMKISGSGTQVPRRVVRYLPAVRDHLAQAGVFGADAHADERQNRLDDHRDAHLGVLISLISSGVVAAGSRA